MRLALRCTATQEGQQKEQQDKLRCHIMRLFGRHSPSVKSTSLQLLRSVSSLQEENTHRLEPHKISLPDLTGRCRRSLISQSA